MRDGERGDRVPVRNIIDGAGDSRRPWGWGDGGERGGTGHDLCPDVSRTGMTAREASRGQRLVSAPDLRAPPGRLAPLPPVPGQCGSAAVPAWDPRALAELTLRSAAMEHGLLSHGRPTLCQKTPGDRLRCYPP